MTKQDKPVILFGITSFSGSVCREFLPSFVETMTVLGAAGIASSICMVPGDPYLSKARNSIVFRFLTKSPGATHLFFLDDDLGWPAQKALDLINHDVDVVAGCYPKKTDKGEYPCQIDVDADGTWKQHNGLWRAKLAPTGFMCIKRHVLEKMAARSGLYVDSTTIGATDAQWNVFDMGWRTNEGDCPQEQAGIAGQWWGEDYYFCRKWRDMGGEVWIDPDIMFTHRGSLAWGGNFKQATEKFFADLAVKPPEAEAAE